MTLKILAHIPKLIITLLLDVIGILILYPFLGTGFDKIVPEWLKWFDNHSGQYGSFIYNKWEIYKWLAIRNPTNYFQYRVLGFQWQEPDQINKYYYNGPNQNPEYSTDIIVAGKRYWEECHYYKWPYIDRYFRYRIGWKIGRLDSNTAGEYVQWCFTITPMIRGD